MTKDRYKQRAAEILMEEYHIWQYATGQYNHAEKAAERALREGMAMHEQDAKRYRWLRDSSPNQYEHPIVVSQRRTGEGITYVGPLAWNELDAAIDAAMLKEEGK